MGKRIAAFGEVMMRLQAPGYDLLSQANTLSYSFSGTGVNVISALARFGHDGYLVTRLPDNPLGDAAAANLRKLGIAQRFVARGGSYIGLYFLENGFGARPSRVTYSNRLESSFNTAPADAYDFADIAGQLDVAHFCGITLAMNDAVRSYMLRFAEAVKARGGLVAFDCNYRPSLWGEGGYEKAKPFTKNAGAGGHRDDERERCDVHPRNADEGNDARRAAGRAGPRGRKALRHCRGGRNAPLRKRRQYAFFTRVSV